MIVLITKYRVLLDLILVHIYSLCDLRRVFLSMICCPAVDCKQYLEAEVDTFE